MSKRPFDTLQPNLSSSDRIKDLKAKTIYKSAVSSYGKARNSYRNYNNTIRFSNQGTLASVGGFNTKSNEMLLNLNRGYALCKDGLDYNVCVNDERAENAFGDVAPDDISGNNKKGLLSCSKTNAGCAVQIDTNSNLYTHFVNDYLPTIGSAATGGPKLMPLISYRGVSGERNSAGVREDESYYQSWNHIGTGNPSTDISASSLVGADGEGVFFDPLGYIGGTCYDLDPRLKLPNYYKTVIRGEKDINGYFSNCQGGNGVNLSWGNNTKQNYLVAYDPRNTNVKFNIRPQPLTKCYADSSGNNVLQDCSGRQYLVDLLKKLC
jgi:hypothetical protein